MRMIFSDCLRQWLTRTSPDIEKSFVFELTGHPCRLDFERFGNSIGLVKRRIDKILNKYMSLPEGTLNLIVQSHLPEKAKRDYTRIVTERTVS